MLKILGRNLLVNTETVARATKSSELCWYLKLELDSINWLSQIFCTQRWTKLVFSSQVSYPLTCNNYLYSSMERVPRLWCGSQERKRRFVHVYLYGRNSSSVSLVSRLRRWLVRRASRRVFQHLCSWGSWNFSCSNVWLCSIKDLSLFEKKVFTWRIPFAMLITVVVISGKRYRWHKRELIQEVRPKLGCRRFFSASVCVTFETWFVQKNVLDGWKASRADRTWPECKEIAWKAMGRWIMLLLLTGTIGWSGIEYRGMGLSFHLESWRTALETSWFWSPWRNWGSWLSNLCKLAGKNVYHLNRVP